MLNKPSDKNFHSLYYTPQEKSSKLGLFFRPQESCHPLSLRFLTFIIYVVNFCYRFRLMILPQGAMNWYALIRVVSMYPPHALPVNQPSMERGAVIKRLVRNYYLFS